MDDQDKPLPPRAVGEICLVSASVTPGYWSDPESTRAAFNNGWFHTGDVGYVDEDGYLFITDRKKDLVIKGGENLSPREIEDVLNGYGMSETGFSACYAEDEPYRANSVGRP